MRKLTAKVVVVLIMLAFMITGIGNLARAATTTYIVQPGDSLWKVATKFNTTVYYLKQLNNYWTNYIEVGQILKVPAPAATPASASWVYTVQTGDTLWKISQKVSISYQTIMIANNLTSAEIVPGQRLTIPGSNNSTSTTSVISYTEAELTLLARIIYAESRGESYTGQVAVGAVLVNRVKSPDFPNTITGVVYQDLAFETVANGEFNLSPNSTAYQAAKDALSGQDPTGGALYFYNPAKVTNPNSWVWTRRVLIKIGNHNFAI